MNRRKLTSMALDAFRELGNIGSGHASAALATMINRKVDITVPKIELVKLSDLSEYADPAEQVVAVHLGVEGDVSGMMTLSVPDVQAQQLIKLLTGMEFASDSEMGASVVKEIANIVSGAFLNALNGMTGLNSMVTPPQFYAGPFRGAFHAVLDLLAQWGDHTFICETTFVNDRATVQSHLIFMPSSPSQLELILQKMGLPQVFEVDAAS